MAPTAKDTTSNDVEDKSRMLKEALKCVTGTLDFDKLAVKMGVANGEAMRKRFKRLFEKDEDPIQLKGSTLGSSSEGAAPSAKTPRTPKVKASASANSDDATGSPKPKSTAKKRKAADTADKEDGDKARNKTDGAVKEPEGERGEAVGEPAKQAVHDGFEKPAASANKA